ncbi:MAG: alanine--glyoxylate aminotransferase family protein, partial [Clostridiales bacterium]
VLIMTCSGTGSLEAALVSFLNRGDKILVASIGNFGDRWRDIAAAYAFDVEYIGFPWGEAIDPQIIREKLTADTGHKIKAILLQQHETSTGVYNPLAEISAARGDHPALLMVDAISGLAACPLETDLWGLDVVISSSQKALMTPPGLSLVSVSPRAWAANQKSDMPKFYLDLGKARKYALDDQTPFTPAISLIYALNEAVKMIVEDGIDQVIRKHYQRRDAVRAAILAMGLQPVAAEACAGGALTAFYTPENIAPKSITSIMNKDYQAVIAGGMGQLKNKTLRFAHLGYVRDLDLLAGISALTMALAANGYPVELGAAAAAFEKTLLSFK